MMSEMQHHLKDAGFLVVDGNSNFETVDIATTLGADFVFQRGKGKGDALRCSISSIDSDCKYVVLTDADYTYPAEHVRGMIEILDNNANVGRVVATDSMGTWILV